MKRPSRRVGHSAGPLHHRGWQMHPEPARAIRGLPSLPTRSRGPIPARSIDRAAARLSVLRAAERSRAHDAPGRSRLAASAAANQGGNHSLSRVAIPPFGARHHFRPTHAPKFFGDVGGIWHKAIRAFANRYRALGVWTDSQTRNSERRGFFLETAGIGDDGERVFDEIEHFEITYRLEHTDFFHLQSGRLESHLGSRMRREHDRPLRCDV